jgi:tetratricopeptide (TPR) repeat protein
MSRLLFAVALAAVSAAAEPPPLERARELYNRTEYEAALALLGPIAHKDSSTYLLMGQCQYMQGESKKSSELFLKAVQLDPHSSDNRLWLARAYGRRAETSSFFTAPGFATKARENFEQAIQLNPMNTEAIGDLFEYYLDAPGFLGGGLDRASALAKRMSDLNPAEYHWELARLAEKRKEYQTAEQHFRSAADLAPRQIGRVIDLARFLAKAGRFQESEEAFQQAEKMDPNSPKLLFERASAYIHAGRNLEAARQLLKRYLEAPLTPDDPPRSQAERLLKAASRS